jgi:hypothetical protein
MSKNFDYNINNLDGNYITILLKEIDLINRQIQQYDEHSLKIKNWAITVWSAAIFFVITQYYLLISSTPFIAELLLYFPLFIPIPFWGFDGLYKKFQRTFIARSEAIRDFLNKNDTKYELGTIGNNDEQDLYKFPIYDPVGRISRNTKYYREKYFKKTKFLRCLLVRIVSMVYFILISFTCLIIIIFTQNYYIFSILILSVILILVSFILGEKMKL